MAKKKVHEFDGTIEVDALQLAALIRGEQVIVDRTLMVLTEVDHDIPTADIMTIITEDMENAEPEEKDGAEGETVEYNEDDEDQDEEE
jgi:uncharacterized protein YaiL (DUF2058 family)